MIGSINKPRKKTQKNCSIAHFQPASINVGAVKKPAAAAKNILLPGMAEEKNRAARAKEAQAAAVVKDRVFISSPYLHAVYKIAPESFTATVAAI